LSVCTLLSSVVAWQHCSEEAGGGVCPNRATCCPSGTQGISGCISGRPTDPPDGQGQCCNLMTGCSYGYSCDVEDVEIFDSNSSIMSNVTSSSRPICRRNDPHPDYLNAPKTNRYEMCRLSPDVALYAQQLNGFPVNPNDSPQLERKVYNLGYYSSLGSITAETGNSNRFASIETILIMLHGSGRTADDYLCAGLSVIPHSTQNLQNLVNDNYHKYLVIAPYFAAAKDTEERSLVENLLYWADKGQAVPLGHTWRYGADALNYNISSYGALDSMMEFIISAKDRFPNLQQIVMAGHSAGGQVVHRWALLSSSPVIWIQSHVEIRAVVANPRSYCYLDNRRVLFHNNTNNTDKDIFAIPAQEDIDTCPGYSQWQWGLEPGGDVVSHYKDRILNGTSSSDLARRYGTRNVFYLTGELDVIEQRDRCEAKKFQGLSRNHRARNYVKALDEYFGDSLHYRHQFNIVSGSPHDHFLMFQSDYGKRALFGPIQAATDDGMEGYHNDKQSHQVPSTSSKTLWEKLSSFLWRCKESILHSAFFEVAKGTPKFRMVDRIQD
jgi:pimeloyl-ACP methyl ester carboxylesterase